MRNSSFNIAGRSITLRQRSTEPPSTKSQRSTSRNSEAFARTVPAGERLFPSRSRPGRSSTDHCSCNTTLMSKTNSTRTRKEHLRRPTRTGLAWSTSTASEGAHHEHTSHFNYESTDDHPCFDLQLGLPNCRSDHLVADT